MLTTFNLDPLTAVMGAHGNFWVNIDSDALPLLSVYKHSTNVSCNSFIALPSKFPSFLQTFEKNISYIHSVLAKNCTKTPYEYMCMGKCMAYEAFLQHRQQIGVAEFKVKKLMFGCKTNALLLCNPAQKKKKSKKKKQHVKTGSKFHGCACGSSPSWTASVS